MKDILVPYTIFPEQVLKLKKELVEAFEKVLLSGQYVLGENVKKFEKEFSTYSNTKFCAGVANGTDALHLIMKCIGIKPGDEVITVPNSFIATAGAIGILGAKPVFVDVGLDMNIDPNQIEKAITSRTKAIMPVHLTGRPAKMDTILELTNHYKIALVEDAAQAVGAKYKDRKIGSFGLAAGYSLHPLKNLHAFGDGGLVTTNDTEFYKLIVQARNHGLINREKCEFWGYNSRLDEMQAAMLSVQLAFLDKWTAERHRLALRYNDLLRPFGIVPDEQEDEYCVFQTYVIQVENRDRLKDFLNGNGVQALIHYPIPLHLQPAAKSLGYKESDFPKTLELSSKILSLPLYPEMKEEQQDYVVELFEKFFHRKN